jgi:uncharacterized protein YwgA
VKRLRERGSWCGETHLQKALFIFQDISKSNLGYKFVIYKHGPYSFELNKELIAMRAARILEFRFLKEGYGPSILPTSFGELVYEINKENIEEFIPVNIFLAGWFEASDVRHLEKVATAYYVTKKNPHEPAIERARKVSSLKPHVNIEAAQEAIRIVDEKRKEAKQLH